TVAALVTAAPAPQPKSSGPWFDGWESPVDSVGDCLFHRHGDRLFLTIPARERRPSDYPIRLLREVEGDFVVQVRVRGESVKAGSSRGVGKAWWSAGLILTDGTYTQTLQRLGCRREDGKAAPNELFFSFAARPSYCVTDDAEGLPAGEGHLRVVREGKKL